MYSLRDNIGDRGEDKDRIWNEHDSYSPSFKYINVFCFPRRAGDKAMISLSDDNLNIT